MTIVCKNCNNHFKGKFCSHCGQAADTHEINMHYLWHEIQHGILHFDSGIVYTTKQLFTRPGHAIREFINGKRVQFFKPFAFVFVLSTIYALLSHYLGLEISSERVEVTQRDIKDARAIQLFNNGMGAFSWLKQHYAYYVLVFLPINSLASYLAFRNKRVNYLKHVVLNAYVIGQRTIIYLFLIPISILTNFDIEASTAGTLIEILLPVWAYSQFFNYSSVWKSILRTILAYIYTGLITLTLIGVYIFLLVLYWYLN